MYRLGIVIAIISFFLGTLVSGLLFIAFTTKAITKIIEGNTYVSSSFYPDYIQALESYEEAQKLWPPLRYNPLFTAEVNNIQTKLKRLSKEPSVIIYIKDKTEDSEIEQFTHKLRTIYGVREVRFVSKEDALTRYRKMHKEDTLLLELVTADLFHKSIEVYLTDPKVKNKVVIFAQNKVFVDHVF
jgi:hypothetical protein